MTLTLTVTMAETIARSQRTQVPRCEWARVLGTRAGIGDEVAARFPEAGAYDSGKVAALNRGTDGRIHARGIVGWLRIAKTVALECLAALGRRRRWRDIALQPHTSALGKLPT
jgi:hypothetical protein